MTNESKNFGDLGLKLTKVYLIIVIGGIPAGAYIGAINLAPMKINEVGDFLAGAFGPVAIFWLILGFFQQGEELKNSVSTLRLQAKELSNSVEAQRELVKVTRETLAFDSEVLRSSTKQRMLDMQPFFIIDFTFSNYSSDGKLTFNLSVRNSGAGVYDLQLIILQSDQCIFTRTLQSLPQNDFKNMKFATDQPIMPDIPMDLHIIFNDREKTEFIQKSKILLPASFPQDPFGIYAIDLGDAVPRD